MLTARNATPRRGSHLQQTEMASAPNHSHIRFVGNLNSKLVHEIERFFVSYNETKGKQFEVLGRFGPDLAVGW